VGASRTKIDESGKLLRDWWRTPAGSDEEAGFDLGELADALTMIGDYRGGFQGPLKKVTVGLRQFVGRESSEVIVGQRLKRTPQILNKLDRFGSMRLTQMEDIAGCRAILPGGAKEIGGVLRRIRRNWDIASIDDYVSIPKDTGYRAIHVVVRRDEHPVEIQLRSPLQHEWAEAVERIAARNRLPLKDGKGPPELLTYLDLVAWAMAADEGGKMPDAAFMQVLARFKAQVSQYWTDAR
jgi:GTP pyrophosphokinase